MITPPPTTPRVHTRQQRLQAFPLTISQITSHDTQRSIMANRDDPSDSL
jgi:hypothetical protein